VRVPFAYLVRTILILGFLTKDDRIDVTFAQQPHRTLPPIFLPLPDDLSLYIYQRRQLPRCAVARLCSVYAGGSLEVDVDVALAAWDGGATSREGDRVYGCLPCSRSDAVSRHESIDFSWCAYRLASLPLTSTKSGICIK
jgi:hypothetical protein